MLLLSCPDFLFCLNSFFSPTVARDRGYEVLLITHLFENINKHFAGNSPMDPDIANSMILRVAQLSESVGSCHFRNLNSQTLESLQNSGPTEEYCNIIADLLQTLFLCQPIQNKPTATNLSTIISALSLKTFADIYENNEQYDRLKCAMAAVLSIAEDWFSDEELGSMLAKDQWKQIIAQDLPGWISHATNSKLFVHVSGGKEVVGATQDEQVLATMFTALTNCWSQVDFPNGEVAWNRYHFRLLDCTVDIAFCARKLGYEILQHPSRLLRETLMVRLGAAIVQVGERVMHKSVFDSRLEKVVKAALQITAEFLAKLGQTITVELRNPPKFEHDASEHAHWIRLEATFSETLFDLREMWERAVGVRLSGKKLLRKFGGNLEPA
ncbi:hypothetical protein B0H14DRAFT_3169067 [Mycena olivaceomarginata]|nr:hypothetical protein B0H14DRAFT_3169067 [Mycena olivaceomarginata]